MKCLIDPKTATPLDTTIAVTEASMYKLPRPHQGQVVCTIDTGKTYIYNDKWVEVGSNIKLKGDGLQMNLYDLNQNIIAQLPTITDFTNSIELINDFKKNTLNQYYMLYSKDISYFTIFHIEQYGELNSLGDGAIECLQNLGDVKCIDYTENKDAIEIWIQQNENNPICAYLFPYDMGIVTIKEN